MGGCMLEKRVYTRAELVDQFKTSRLDAIKNRIQRAGYIYAETGRGAGYTLEILDLPKGEEFKRYCIDVLGYDPRTDFVKLKAFLYHFLADDEFMTLQHNEMSRIIEENTGIRISPATISNYFDQLKARGWSDHGAFDYVCYIYDNDLKQNRYISREEYCAIYREFYAIVRRNNGNFQIAETRIKEKYGNKPKKRPREMKSAFFNKEYSDLWEIIEK